MNLLNSVNTLVRCVLSGSLSALSYLFGSRVHGFQHAKVACAHAKKHALPVIFAGNHLCWLEQAMLVWCMLRLRVSYRYVAKSQYEGNRFLKWLYGDVGRCVFVDRSSGEQRSQAYRTLLRVLKEQGESIILYPHGTYTWKCAGYDPSSGCAPVLQSVPALMRSSGAILVPFGVRMRWGWFPSITFQGAVFLPPDEGFFQALIDQATKSAQP